MANADRGTGGSNGATTSRASRCGRVTRALAAGLGVALAGKLVLLATSWTGVAVDTPAIAADAAKPQVAAAKPDLATVKLPSVDAAGRTSAPKPAQPPEGKPPDVRALVDAIARRQTELDGREREIVAREERLRVYEQDVVAKIASLEEIEKRLQARAKAATATVDAAAESLAKVYGAMKPADAAPILERLDEPTVLTIFGRMKEKQIGEILPLMSKEKAIALTQALAAHPLR
jgi:flagellar motility protein MotE (MotC chaperone)